VPRDLPVGRAALLFCAWFHAILLQGCARLPRDLAVQERLLQAPGAPDGCRAAYVLPARPPRQRDDEPQRFHQQQGQLLGPDWGACVRMGPEPEAGRYLWVLMVWRPAWRGPVQCRLGRELSPLLLLGPPDSPPDAEIKVKWYLADEGAELLRGPDLPIPTRAVPCPTVPPSALPP